MTENMKKFLEAVSKDAELTAKVGNMGMEELLVLARELGLALTEADLTKPAVQELNDDELDAVAGGSDVSCACAMGGGGTKDSNDKACACVPAGAGYLHEWPRSLRVRLRRLRLRHLIDAFRVERLRFCSPCWIWK